MTQPTAPGYWWAKGYGGWRIVEVVVKNTMGSIDYVAREFGYDKWFRWETYTEWQGPIVRESKP